MHYLQLLFTDQCRIDDLGSSKNLKLECVVSQEGAKDLARAVSMVEREKEEAAASKVNKSNKKLTNIF